MRALTVALVLAATTAAAVPASAGAERAPTSGEARLIKASITNYLRTTVPSVQGPYRISHIRVSSASKRWATARVHAKALGNSAALLQRLAGGHGSTAWGVNAIGYADEPIDCARTPAAVRTDLGLDCG